MGILACFLYVTIGIYNIYYVRWRFIFHTGIKLHLENLNRLNEAYSLCNFINKNIFVCVL